MDVIVGAGLSGLVCARRLVAAGRDVRVVEASARVGGRLRGVQVGDGVFDLGGQWWSEGQPSLAALADELGVERVRQFRTGAAVLGLASGPRRWLPARMFAALARGRRMAAISRMIARAGAGDAPAGWDGESLGAWLAREVPDPELRAHVALHCELTFAVEPAELSLLDYLAQLGAAGGWGDPFDADKGGQEHRFVPGAHALPARLAAALGDRVALGCPVTAIAVDGDAVTVTTARETLRAEHVVLAIPPAAARAIRFDPALPPAAAAAAHAARPGAVVKCVATYARPFWREAGLSGEAYLSPGLVRATVDACSADGAVAALAVFVVAQQAASWADAPADERRAQVCRELAILFGDEAAAPRAFGFVDWRADPWAGGCVASMPPDARTGGAAWRGPFAGRVHVAGTEAATRWPGFMEGAIDAGDRAARAVLAT